MPLTDDKVTIDINRLSIADIDDFKALTGKDLEAYLDEVRDRGDEERTLAETFSTDFRAMLWIVLRDDKTRERLYESVDELHRTMQQDIRRIGLTDFDRFDIASDQPTAPRTTSTSRAARRQAYEGRPSLVEAD